MAFSSFFLTSVHVATEEFIAPMQCSHAECRLQMDSAICACVLDYINMSCLKFFDYLRERNLWVENAEEDISSAKTGNHQTVMKCFKTAKIPTNLGLRNSVCRQKYSILKN